MYEYCDHLITLFLFTWRHHRHCSGKGFVTNPSWPSTASLSWSWGCKIPGFLENSARCWRQSLGRINHAATKTRGAPLTSMKGCVSKNWTWLAELIKTHAELERDTLRSRWSERTAQSHWRIRMKEMRAVMSSICPTMLRNISTAHVCILTTFVNTRSNILAKKDSSYFSLPGVLLSWSSLWLFSWDIRQTLFALKPTETKFLKQQTLLLWSRHSSSDKRRSLVWIPG